MKKPTEKISINPKIEKELVEFKIEIEDKFKKSPLRTFGCPRKKHGGKV